MNVKFLLKIFNKFLKLFDLKIINENNFKNHPDYIVLIKSLIENQNPTIFDVGAHHGESVENFNKYLLSCSKKINDSGCRCDRKEHVLNQNIIDSKVF